MNYFLTLQSGFLIRVRGGVRVRLGLGMVLKLGFEIQIPVMAVIAVSKKVINIGYFPPNFKL